MSSTRRSVLPEGRRSTQRENYQHLLTVLETTQGESTPSHKSPGWEKKHPVEAAVEEAVVEAMAKGEAGIRPVGTARMNDPTTKQTPTSLKRNSKMQCLTLAQ